MLHAQKLNKSFWVEAMANVIYTRNQYPVNAMLSITPKQV